MKNGNWKLNLGEIYKTNFNGVLQVIDYADCKKYKVRFLATGYETTASLDKIKLGKVKDRLMPFVSGVGYIGYGKHTSSNNRKVYCRWKKMLARCYSGNFPNYDDCIVCNRWHNFQNFADDFVNLPGYQEDIRGLDLDKDTIIEGNRIYSPYTCCLIPHSENSRHAMMKFNKRYDS